MSEPLFIETMRVEAGEIANFERHLHRMRATCAEVFGCEPDMDAIKNIAITVGAQKCRIVYGRDIKTVEFGEYTPRNIRSLKLIEASSTLDYHLKYANRAMLTELTAMKENCDEVLIVRDGHITDTSFSNVVFTDGKEWITPRTCLLPGTMRAKLLEEGRIKKANITPADMSNFTHVALINAMLPPGRMPLIPIENIL